MRSGDPFRWVRLKLQRAREHCETLDREMLTWFRHEPDRVVGQLNDDRTGINPVLATGEMLPTAWPLFVSDCLQNFRSSLDHIAVLCARRGDHPGAREVEFRITEAAAQWATYAESQGGRRVRRRIGNDAWDLIEDLQPHVRGLLNVDEDPLWGLNKLARIDRHQTIHLAVVAKRGTWIGFGPLPQVGNVLSRQLAPDQARFAIRPVVDNPVIGRVEFHPPQADVTTYGQVMFEVVFDPDGEVAQGFTVIQSLQAIDSFVTHHVLPRFEALQF